MVGNRLRCAAAAAAVYAIALACGPAAAQDVDAASNSSFTACDGHPPPTAKTDGIMTDIGNNAPGPRYGPTHLANGFGFGQAGVAACDAALRDPLLTPELWMRRVSLLRARAGHNLSAGDTKAALADLDGADAAAKDRNFLYERGLALGVDLLRAYALRQAGRQAEAEALALKSVASRPYERHVVLAALTAVGPKADPRVLNQLLRSLARLQPETLTLLYNEAYDQGRFDEALAISDALTPTLAKDTGVLYPDQVREDAQNHYIWELFWVERSGEKAYVLAASGKADEAHAELAAMRAHVQGLQPPSAGREPFATKDLPPDPVWVQKEQQLKSDADVALARWGALVDARLEVGTGGAQAVASRLDPTMLVPSGATVELMRAIAARLPKGVKPPLDPDTLAAGLAQRRAAALPSSLDFLYRSLPEVDGWPILPQYKPLAEFTWNWRRGILLNGFTAEPGKPEDGGGVIRFHGPSSSQMDVEEMALLRAVDMARRIHRGVLVLKLADRLHVRVQMDYYGHPTSRSEEGYEAEIQVLFVDPANLPEKYRGSPWRVLNADEAYASLRPAYPSKE